MTKASDLIGQQKGILTIVERVSSDKKGKAQWVALCNCGNKTNPFTTGDWNSGKRVSCGCRGSSIGKVQVGDKFFKWTVIEKITSAYFYCKCECGEIGKVRKCDLANGNSKNCVNCGYAKHIKADNTAAKNAVLRTYKINAKSRNYCFELSDEDCINIFTSNCEYCGREPQMVSTTTNGSFWYNGIDRQDNSIGYKLDNVVPCCWACNAAKRAMPLEDFILWLEAIADFRKLGD